MQKVVYKPNAIKTKQKKEITQIQPSYLHSEPYFKILVINNIFEVQIKRIHKKHARLHFNSNTYTESKRTEYKQYILQLLCQVLPAGLTAFE